ncbi:MAG: hypothetical protein K6F09_05420 [Clostridiales bacterium]|nr:hypothetical protein [Clostridiales bacterium]
MINSLAKRVGLISYESIETTEGETASDGDFSFTDYNEPEKQSDDENTSFNQYAYSLLDDNEKWLYNRMNKAVAAHKSELGFLAIYDSDTIYKVNAYLLYDHPEYFWNVAEGTVWTQTIASVTFVTRYNFKYWASEKEIPDMQKNVDEAADKFLSGVDKNASDYDKALAVYEYVIDNTKYDYTTYEKEDEDDDTRRSRSLYGVFADKNAVCAGYAKAAQYLLEKLGIQSVYIIGGEIKSDGNHAWLLVKLDGEYYYMDPTWGDPSNKDGEQKYNIRHEYFCMNEEELLRKHVFNESTISVPECKSQKCNYFVKNGTLLSGADYDKIEAVVKKAVSEKQPYVEIQFTTKEKYNEAKRYLFERRHIFDILRDVEKADPKFNNSRHEYYSDNDMYAFKLLLNYKK